jgi:MFS family permease
LAVAVANEVADVPNHPLAVRMGVIAGVSHNVVIGTIMGSFSVLLASAEQRLNIAATQASTGIPLVLLGASISAPIIGVLIGKFSLRLILLIGALLTVVGFLTLGLTHSYLLYVIAYGLCFGPAMSLAGSIGPATLVARWFNQNRGLALGVVHLPVVIAIMPVGLNWFIEHYGATAAYLALAMLAALVLVPLTLLAVDHPPTGETVAPEPAEKRTADGSFSVAQLLSKPRFWAICLAATASMTSSLMLGSLLVPMGQSWDFTRGQSALLASIMSLVGIAGSVLFGWIADKLGGGRTLALVAFDCAILWAVLLTEPPFLIVALVVGLIGMHGAGAIPGLGRAISDAFGQATFSRGFGLNTIISLPFVAVGVVGSAKAGSNGSFAPAIMAIVGFFVVAMLLGLYGATGPKAQTVARSPT